MDQIATVSTIERIDRGYALIYIDREGETLNTDSFFTPEMTTEYYKNNGPLQWNHYLIIPEELVTPKVSDFDNVQKWQHAKNVAIETITSNDNFARKIVLPLAKIDYYILSHFPIQTTKFGRITLVKGKNWLDAQDKSRAMYKEESEKIFQTRQIKKIPRPIPSWYRDFSMLDTLTQLDLLRADLIRDPNLNVIFFTHIRKEYNVARQKFFTITSQTDEQFFSS